MRGGSMRGGTWCFQRGGTVVAVEWVGDTMLSKRNHGFVESERGCVVEVRRGAR